MHADHELLFGVLAVQLGFAEPSQIMACAGAWSVDPSRGLADRLEGEAIISNERRTMLEHLVSEAVKAHGNDINRTMADFGGEDAVFQSFGGSLFQTTCTETAESGSPSFEIFDIDKLDDPYLTTLEHPGRYEYIDISSGDVSADKTSARFGKGDISEAFLVYDVHLCRNVVCKELPHDHEFEESERYASKKAYFLRSARITSQLEHPNIVPIHELGHRLDGSLYYTTKFIEGRTLEDILKGCGSLEERMGLLDHYISLCQAVSYAHSRGVIHRDLKPENVMMGEFGETVLIYWGIAMLKKNEAGETRQERKIHLVDDIGIGLEPEGIVIGTPEYMSPEQARGQNLDEQSDIWALGAILYEILTGKMPFGPNDEAVEILRDIISKDPQTPTQINPSIPETLSALTMRSLSKEKEARPGSVNQIIQELEEFRKTRRKKQAEQMEAILHQYLSPVVIEKLKRGVENPELELATRNMTIMFVSIQDFINLIEEFPIEEFVDGFLSPYFQLAVSTIESYGGDVNKFLGEDLLVIFEDDRTEKTPQFRALECAFKLQEKFHDFNESQRVAQYGCPGIRIGINCGEVTIGNFGCSKRMDYSVLGETVNLANVACTRSAPGKTAITRELLHTLEESVDSSGDGQALPFRLGERVEFTNPRGKSFTFHLVEASEGKGLSR